MEWSNEAYLNGTGEHAINKEITRQAEYLSVHSAQ
jgi:hypothetical protein